jgi:hypothetical protein
MLYTFLSFVIMDPLPVQEESTHPILSPAKVQKLETLDGVYIRGMDESRSESLYLKPKRKEKNRCSFLACTGNRAQIFHFASWRY